MRYKKIMMLTIILTCLLAVSAVSAAENVTDDIIGTDVASEDVVSVDSDNQVITVGNDSVGSFVDLETEINNLDEKGVLNITKDYMYVNGSKGGIKISKSIFIDGNGHTFDGNNLSKLFIISGDNVTIKNINIINCKADVGGAISWIGDNGTLINCHFTNNAAQKSYGGAIYWTGCNRYLINCTFSKNTIITKYDWEYSLGSTLFINVTRSYSNFKNNTDKDFGTFINCKFLNSESTHGGIYYHRSVNSQYFNLSPHDTFINSTFINCNIDGSYDLNCYDSNILIRYGSGKFTNCTINSLSTGYSSTYYNSTVFGSSEGIFYNSNVFGESSGTFYNCNISEESSGTFYNCNISGESRGKFVNCYLSNILIQNVKLNNFDKFFNNTYNLCKFNLSESENNITNKVFDSSVCIIINSDNFIVSNCKFYNIGGCAIECDNKFGTISNCNFTNANINLKSCHGIINNCSFISSKIDWESFKSSQFPSSSIFNSTFINCNSYAIRSYWVSISNCTFKNNKYGIIATQSRTSVSNCMFINNSNSAIKLILGKIFNCTFINNSADYGGAINCIIDNVTGSNFEISQCTFVNNSADYGGAIYSNYNKKLNINYHISDCLFINNTAKHDGGAVYNAKYIHDCVLKNNSANNGGGVYDFVFIESCLFDENSAYNGAAIHTNTYIVTDTLEIKNSNFTKNQALRYGVIFIDKPVNINSCIFIKNNFNNGVIYSRNSQSSVEFSIFIEDKNIDKISPTKSFYAYNNWWGNTFENYNQKPIVGDNVVFNNWYFLNLTSSNYSINNISSVKCDLLECRGTGVNENFYSEFPNFDLNYIIGSFSNVTTLINGSSLVNYDVNYLTDNTILFNYHGVEILLNVGIINEIGIDKESLNESNLKIFASDLYYGQQQYIKFFLPQYSTGTISIYIDNKYVKDILVGEEYNLNTLDVGKHIIKAIYNGDDNYNSSSDEINITVMESHTSESLNESNLKIFASDLYYGQQQYIKFFLPQYSTGTISIYIDNKYVKDILVGEEYNLNTLDVGKHIIKAIYNGDDNYNSSSDEINITVMKEYPNLKIEVNDTEYGNSINIHFTISCYYSIPMGYINVSNYYYGSKLVEIINGESNLIINNLPKGQQGIYAEYYGDKNHEYTNAFVLFNVTERDLSSSIIIPTEIIASGFNTVYNGGEYIVATLKDKDGNPMKYVKVTVTFSNGKTDTQTTNKKGIVQFSTNGLAPVKKYYATITFDGNAKYEQSTTTVKVKVYKATPKITAKAQKFKRSDKKKQYTIRLLTNQNIKMKYTKVYIKVNNKLYYAKTNKKGYATFSLKKLTKKGTYKAKIMYYGDAFYNPLTTKVKLTVK